MHVYFCVLFIKNKVHYCILLLFTNKYTIMYNKVTRLIQSNTDKPEKLITSNPYTCDRVRKKKTGIVRKMIEAVSS